MIKATATTRKPTIAERRKNAADALAVQRQDAKKVADEAAKKRQEEAREKAQLFVHKVEEELKEVRKMALVESVEYDHENRYINITTRDKKLKYQLPDTWKEWWEESDEWPHKVGDVVALAPIVIRIPVRENEGRVYTEYPSFKYVDWDKAKKESARHPNFAIGREGFESQCIGDWQYEIAQENKKSLREGVAAVMHCIQAII